MENLKLRVKILINLIIFITWFQTAWKKVKNITRKIVKFIFNHPIIMILGSVGSLFIFVLLIVFQFNFFSWFISFFNSILAKVKEYFTIDFDENNKISDTLIRLAGVLVVTNFINTSLQNSNREFYGISLDKISLWNKRKLSNIFMFLSLLSPLIIVLIGVLEHTLFLLEFFIAIFFVNAWLCCRTIWIQRDFIKKQNLVIKKVHKIIIRYIAELYERKNDKIQYDQYHDYTYFYDIVSAIVSSKDNFSVSINLFLINIHKSVNDFLFSLINLKDNPIIKLLVKSETLKKLYDHCVCKAALILNCMMIENISANSTNMKESYVISIFNNIKQSLTENEDNASIKQNITEEELTLYFSCISGVIMGLLLSNSMYELDKLLESVFYSDITDKTLHVHPVYIKEICSVLVIKILDEKSNNISSLANYSVVFNYHILAWCKFDNAKQKEGDEKGKYYISNEKKVDISFIDFIISVCKEIVESKK